jgi:hypothetical protein
MKTIIRVITLLFVLYTLNVVSCLKEPGCYNCGNKPPIANAGADQKIVLPKDSVLLDGSLSSEPDGSIKSFRWTKISGPISANIINPDSSKTLVNALGMGVYKFELTVTDNGGLKAKDTVQIMVDNPAINQPPIAKAGPDQTITLPTNNVLLDGGESSDPDGSIIAYNWKKISGPPSFYIIKPDSSKTDVSALAVGIYTFELTVTDNGGLKAKDTVQIIVKDTLSVKEFVFESWWVLTNDIQEEIEAATEDRPELFDNPSKTMRVSIKLENSTNWIDVPDGYTFNNYSYFIYNHRFLDIYSPHPLDYSLNGKRVSIKVGIP